MPVAGLRLAVVLRAQNGANLLIQTHGVSGRGAQDATNEVAATIAKFSAAGGKGNIDGTGDNPPGFGAGQLSAVQGLYCVTYRLVNAVYAMVVALPGANVFLCMQLLDAVAKVLVGVAKGVDVTPDKVVKRYTEVYLLLEDLLATGLSTLPPAFMHSSATSERLLVLPTSAADAARRFRRMVRGGGRGGTAFAPAKPIEDKEAGKGASADPTPPPVPETPSSRGGQQFSSAYADPLGAVAFDIPPDALPAPPARAAVARRAPTAAPLGAPLRPTPPPPAFKGALEEEAAKVPPAEAEGFGAFGEVEMLEAQKAAAPAAAAAAVEPEGWAQFGEGEEVAAAPAEAAPAAPAAPALPVATEKDVKDSLQLTEVWRAEVAGGEVMRAGLEGNVRRRLAPYGLAAARFRLLPAPAGVVNACLRVAAMNRDFAEVLDASVSSGSAAAGGSASSTAAAAAGGSTSSEGDGSAGGAFLAKFTQASVGCCYLQYSLPAVACPPPLQAALLTVPGSDPAKPGSWQGLVVLRYAASPALPASLLDVAVDLNVPPEAASLLRVSPAAQWSREGCQLRWALPRIAPGATGELRAVFGCKAGVVPAAATAALARQAEARLLFSARPGRSLSGVGFQVAAAEDGAPFQPAHVQCFGELTVRT
ncbi:hypothetical protein ABPG75_013363 [Micractinium tetrahymenae]